MEPLATDTYKKIRKLLIDEDLTGAKVARRIGVHRSAINRTIKGERKSYRIRKAIANALHLKVTDLWPEKEGTL